MGLCSQPGTEVAAAKGNHHADHPNYSYDSNSSSNHSKPNSYARSDPNPHDSDHGNEYRSRYQVRLGYTCRYREHGQPKELRYL